MTLTLPTPGASNTARQRFALELLLQQRVPGPDLLASRYLLEEPCRMWARNVGEIRNGKT